MLCARRRIVVPYAHVCVSRRSIVLEAVLCTWPLGRAGLVQRLVHIAALQPVLVTPLLLTIKFIIQC